MPFRHRAFPAIVLMLLSACGEESGPSRRLDGTWTYHAVALQTTCENFGSLLLSADRDSLTGTSDYTLQFCIVAGDTQPVFSIPETVLEGTLSGDSAWFQAFGLHHRGQVRGDSIVGVVFRDSVPRGPIRVRGFAAPPPDSLIDQAFTAIRIRP